MATDHNFKIKNGLAIADHATIVKNGSETIITSTGEIRFRPEGSSSNKVRISLNTTYIEGSLDVSANIDANAFRINGTTVIDSNRNLTNIGTINSGAITSTGNSTFSGVIGVGGTSTNSSYGVYLQNNKWYATQYSSSHDVVRMNANTGGGLDVYNQTDSAFANVNVGSLSISGTGVINSSRNLINIGTISSGAITSGGDITLNGANYDLIFTDKSSVIQFGSAGTNTTWSAPKIWRTSGNFIAISDYSGVELGGYNGTAYGARLRVEGNGDVNIIEGGLEIAGTTVIDSSRNLTNIGAITAATINTGQGSTEVYLMNQNVRSSDSPTFQDLTIQGNLAITGDINSYNVTDLDVVDKTITLGVGGTASANDAGGIIVDGANAKLTWDNGDSRWSMNKSLQFHDGPTTTNQGMGIFFTGFDKEATSDYTDNASIIHTINTGGHTGSVLLFNAQNDANDGIAFTTNASSSLKHNSSNILTAANFTSNVTPVDSTKLPLAGGTMTGTLNMGGNAFTGNNFNISGVNQISLNDPGEGIVFGSNCNLYLLDDAADNILRLDAAGGFRLHNGPLSMGTTTVIDTSLNLTNIGTISASEITAGKFVAKQLTGSGIGSSYDERVVLLCPKVETNNSYTNIVNGKLVALKTGGNVCDSFDIFVHSVYNDTRASFVSSGQRTNHKFVTCTYGGIKWVAIKFGYTANPYNYFQFEGVAQTNFPSNGGNQLKVISYYDTQSGGTVLNAEINNSIADYNPDNTYTVFENGSTTFNSPISVLSSITSSGTITASGGNSGNWNTAYTTANAALPKAGGSMTGALNINVNGDALNLRSTTNAQPVRLTFSSDVPAAQIGHIEYTHSDGASYGSNEAFTIAGTENTMTILADGKLMYKDGIYSKPASGTGAGTRKDANWDTAYGWGNHASGGYITGNQTITLTGDVTGSGTTSISVTVADDSHNHVLANVDRVTLTSSNNLNDYNTQSIISWGSSQPTNSPGGYSTGFVLQDNNQPQQLVQTYGGNTNKVKLYGRRRTSGTWDSTWTQYFSDHYHPNADTLTTARTIAGTSFNGSANIDINYNNLTNKPTIPSLSGYATESYVGTQISNLVDSSPAALNTLNELAAAIGDDANFSTTVTNNIATKLPLAGGTMTGQLIISGTSPQMKFNDTDADDFWIHVNSNTFYVLTDRDDSGGWETPYPLELRNSNATGVLYGHRIFADNYHPNADTWTTARTITLGGDLTGNVSINGSSNVTLTAAVVNDSHTHDGRYYTETETDNLLNAKTSLDHIRSLGAQAFTGTATTAGYISEMESDGAFDSYSSVFKTSWSYAGNFNISDGGTFGPTETAGMSHLTWTDNSSDTTRGNITVLAIAPNTGGSGGRTFIYNDQGSTYSPGWREIWTSRRMGAGTGLDADKLDAQEGSYYLDYNNLTNIPTNRVIKDSLTANSTSSITTFTSAAAINTASGGQSSLQVYRSGSGQDAFMSFHVGGDFACYLGLDGGTNKLSVGGWSMGANSYEIYHAGNKPSLATLGYTGATNANYITNNNQLTNGASYITSSHTGFDSRYITKGGSWNASNMPGSRHAGISVNGGEVVFQRDNPNNGQMSVLVDGAFYAGENNGFYSLYSGNSYNSKSGFNADTSGHLQFSAQTYAQFNTQHGNIQLGPMNGSYAHIYTNLGGGFYFNRTLLYANGNTMWHAGNDGSGSGLDADTLDGTQLSAIYSNSAVANTSVNKVYENSAITFGASYLQWMDNSGTGGTGLNGAQPGNPFSDWHHHLVQNHGNSGGYYVDIASSFHNDRVHFRRLQNGTFGSWREFWHNGNDGSGSGLDADLLDGYNAEEGAVNNSIVKRDGTASIKAHGLSLMRQSTPTTGISWYNEAYYNWQDYMASAGVTSCGPNGNLTAPTGLAGVTSWALRSRMEGVSTYGWNWETGGGGGGGATATSKMSLNATTGNLQITGSFTAGGDVTAYSDKKLKDDVKVIENAVEKIKQVRGITFIRNDIEDSKRQAGVIAQEVEKVLPEVVGYDKDRDTKTVAYGNMVSLLIEAIKEQQETIDKLTSRIDDIEKGE